MDVDWTLLEKCKNDRKDGKIWNFREAKNNSEDVKNSESLEKNSEAVAEDQNF